MKQVMTKVIRARVAQVRPVRMRRLCMLLSPSRKAVMAMPSLPNGVSIGSNSSSLADMRSDSCVVAESNR